MSEYECTEHLLNEIERLREANFELREGELKQRIKQLEAVVNDPHALWDNWLRGDVKLPAGIGDVRQYQDRIKRLEEDLGDAYAEMRKQYPAITAVFDRSVWTKAKEDKPCRYCLRSNCECSDSDIMPDIGDK